MNLFNKFRKQRFEKKSENNTSKVKKNELIIPEGTTEIKKGEFECNNNIKHVVIPEGVKTIGDMAFSYCKNLTSIVIPDTVTEIGAFAFTSCNKLENVYINSLSKWCNIDFRNCYSNPMSYADNLYLNGKLIKKLIIPENITKIKKNSFWGCSKLKEVIIPEGVTEIGMNAFGKCIGLTRVVFPESIKVIEVFAFENCYELKEAKLPENHVTIINRAFSGCNKLCEDAKLRIAQQPNIWHESEKAKGGTFFYPSDDPDYDRDGVDLNKYSWEIRTAGNGERYVAVWR